MVVCITTRTMLPSPVLLDTLCMDQKEYNVYLTELGVEMFLHVLVCSPRVASKSRHFVLLYSLLSQKMISCVMALPFISLMFSPSHALVNSKQV